MSFAENSRDENLVHLSNNDIDFSWCLKFPTEDNGFIKNFINKIFSHNNQIENVEAVYCENVDTEANIMATNKNESRITYENVFSDSVDIQYTVLPGKVKENIVLDQKVGFESYTMSIICEGLSAVITEENCVEFLDANKEPQYIIQAPYMYDDIYEISYDIEMNLVATDEGYDITIFPDQDWLNSEERVYPIVIDPTVRTNTTKSNFSDTYIY